MALRISKYGYLITKCCSSSSRGLSTKVAPPVFSYKEKPQIEEISHDYIGPIDKESNLRPVLRHIPWNETPLQERLRARRTEVENWNQKFWTDHNRRFYDEKESFTAANKSSKDDTLSADEMSVFYKEFLDKNWRTHIYYNASWYIKNIELLVLAARVNLEKLYRRRR